MPPRLVYQIPHLQPGIRTKIWYYIFVWIVPNPGILRGDTHIHFSGVNISNGYIFLCVGIIGVYVGAFRSHCIPINKERVYKSKSINRVHILTFKFTCQILIYFNNISVAIHITAAAVLFLNLPYIVFQIPQIRRTALLQGNINAIGVVSV